MIPRATYWAQAQEAAEAVHEAGLTPVHAVLQCGSGMALLAERLLSAPRRLELAAIPHFPAARVAGHGHEAVYGGVGKVRLLVLTGRAHLYEGHSPLEAGFPAALAAALAARLFVAANAAGGLAPGLAAGGVLLHESFINLQGDNPLQHLYTEVVAERFIDPNPAFDPQYAPALLRQLEQCGLAVESGVYVGVRGPAYETSAELKMLRLLGADAVGMSCLPEYLLCHFFGVPVLGLSVIANHCFDAERFAHGARLCHDAVVQGVHSALEPLAAALRGFIIDAAVASRLLNEV